MSLTSKDIEEIERKPFKEPPFSRFMITLVRLFARNPTISRYISESMGGLSGRIFRCWEKENYEEASRIAIHALEKYRNKKSKLLPFMDHHHWWRFMKHGVDSARMIENKEIQGKLVQYANSGIEPFEGFDVAYSYLQFSKWEYQAVNYKEAIKFAEIASEADSTWAEPDFLLGWYGLLLSTGKAEDHLSMAIDKDKRILFRIANNEICKQYPHIINKLKAKYSTSDEMF